jgi:hypothetical protein
LRIAECGLKSNNKKHHSEIRNGKAASPRGKKTCPSEKDQIPADADERYALPALSITKGSFKAGGN